MKTIIFNYLSLIFIVIFQSQIQSQSSTIDVYPQSVCEHGSRQIDVLKSGNDNLKLRFEMMDHHFVKQQQHQEEVQRQSHSLEEMLENLQLSLMEQQKDHRNELEELVESMGGGGKNCNHDQSDYFPNIEEPEFLREFQKVYKLQEDILVKLDTECPPSKASFNIDSEEAANANDNSIKVSGINVCWHVYTKILNELNSNLTILQNIDSKLNKVNEQYEDELKKHKKSLAITQTLLKFSNTREKSKTCVRSHDQNLLCTSEPYPTSCADYDASHCSNGKCHIKNLLYGTEAFQVSCDDDTTDGGGWTVIQRRINGSVDFYRGWSEYKAGFGYLDGEFWIGLDKLHALTTTLATVELLIQLKDHNDTMKYAKYGKFSIGSELEMYELKEADDYEGNAGDSFGPHKGSKFTTKDVNNDVIVFNCAIYQRGAWWYNDCQWSNLNGFYYKTSVIPKNERGEGITWGSFHDFNYSLKFVQMMIRPNKG